MYILTLFSGSLVSSNSSIPATSTTPPAATVSVEVVQGLPHLTVPLPSRNEPCIFVLKPVTNTIGDLIMMLKTEDHGKKLDCQKDYINSRTKKRTTTVLSEPPRFWQISLLYLNQEGRAYHIKICPFFVSDFKTFLRPCSRCTVYGKAFSF